MPIFGIGGIKGEHDSEREAYNHYNAFNLYAAQS